MEERTPDKYKARILDAERRNEFLDGDLKSVKVDVEVDAKHPVAPTSFEVVFSVQDDTLRMRRIHTNSAPDTHPVPLRHSIVAVETVTNYLEDNTDYNVVNPVESIKEAEVNVEDLQERT